MNVTNHLTPIAELLGLEALEFDDRGICTLDFDDRFQTTLEVDEDGDTLHLYAVLGQAPEDAIDQLTCFAAMLDANLFGRGTGGAALAFDGESGSLMLSRSCSVTQPGSNGIASVFSAFVSATEFWQQQVAGEFWRDADGSPETPGHDEQGAPAFIKV